MGWLWGKKPYTYEEFRADCDRTVAEINSDRDARRDESRKRFEEAMEQKRRQDADAIQRSLSYEPPVRVIKGKHNEFIEVTSTHGPTLCVPLGLIAGTSFRRRRYGVYNIESDSPSDISHVVVEMASGTKHSVAVETASGELLLAAINAIWRAA